MSLHSSNGSGSLQEYPQSLLEENTPETVVAKVRLLSPHYLRAFKQLKGKHDGDDDSSYPRALENERGVFKSEGFANRGRGHLITFPY